MSEIKERLARILEEILGDDALLEKDDLIDSGVLDSLDVVALITEISDEFDIVVTAGDVIPENFNSLDAMASMIKQLEG